MMNEWKSDTSDSYVGSTTFNSVGEFGKTVIYRDSVPEFQRDVAEPSDQITIVNCFDDEILDAPPQIDSETEMQRDQNDFSSINDNQMDNADLQYEFRPEAQNAITVPCNCKGDNLEKFFDSISSTIRQFPPLEIAQAKVAISNIVGAMEVELLKKQL